jgi:hypothetical protein
MTQVELAAAAAAMLAELAASATGTGHAERVLRTADRKPVYLSLLRRHDRIQLLVGHRDCYPRLEDAQRIAAHFGVGEETDARAQTARLPSQDGGTVPVRGLTFTWIQTQGSYV